MSPQRPIEPPPPVDPTAEAPPLRTRPMRFDWSRTPLHWVPDDPFTTHVINVLHLIAPVGERRFVKALQRALPLIPEGRLKADAKGFMGQEAAHAHAHAAFLEYLKAHGIDTDDYLRFYEGLYDVLTGSHPAAPLPEAWWLPWNLAVTAAAEQITCVLGDWVLETEGLDAAGADPTMLDLLRWHGAEEVEHRAVAFDVLRALTGPAEYPLRVAAMAAVFPILVGLWHYGTAYLIVRDASLTGRLFSPLDYARAVSQDRAPGLELAAAALRFLRPDFHPANESALEKAQAFFASWPGPRPAAT